MYRRAFRILSESKGLPARITSSGREDLIQFVNTNAAALEAIRTKHKTPQKNFKHYWTRTVDFSKKSGDWVKGKAKTITETDWKKWSQDTFRFRTPEEKEAKKVQKALSAVESNKQVAKYYIARDVQGTLVIKQCYFEDGCRMNEFADRMRDAEILFRRLPPFGDLSMKVIPDPTWTPPTPSPAPTTEKAGESPSSADSTATTTTTTTDATATDDKKSADVAAASSSTATASATETTPPPRSDGPAIEFDEKDFSVVVKDSCTPKELYDFLERDAMRVQLQQAAWLSEQERVRKLVLEVIEKCRLSDVKYNMANGGETAGDVVGICEQLMRCPVYYRKFLEGLVIRIKSDQDALAFDLEKEFALVVPSRLYRPLVMAIPLQYRVLNVFNVAFFKMRYFFFLIFLSLLGEFEMI